MNKKIFTAKQVILLIILILTLIVGLAVYAFLIDEKILQRSTLWATLVFGTGTIITSILAIGISIFSLKKDDSLRHQRIKEDANKFINENNEEILYIPLCLIANAFDNHHRFVRKIYNAFNILNKELQQEILKQLNYDYELIANNRWIEKSIKLIRDYIAENNLGSDFLYDNAKYFHRAMNYADLQYDSHCEYEHLMPDVFNRNPKIFFTNNKSYTENVSFFTYLDSYLTAKKNDPTSFWLNMDKKPLSVITEIEDLRNCPEEKICYWMMEIVVSITRIIIRDNGGVEDMVYQLTKGDARIETFEDRYLEVLMELYNLHLTLHDFD